MGSNCPVRASEPQDSSHHPFSTHSAASPPSLLSSGWRLQLFMPPIAACARWAAAIGFLMRWLGSSSRLPSLLALERGRGAVP